VSKTFQTRLLSFALALAYAVSDLSLKDVAAWASAMHLRRSLGLDYFIACAKPEAGWNMCWRKVLAPDRLDRTALGLCGCGCDCQQRPGIKPVQWRPMS